MYKPTVRVNVAEGAYVVILNWQAEGSAVKGAGFGYGSNNGKAWIQVSGDTFQGFIVSRFQAMGDCIAARVEQAVRRENALMSIGPALGHGVLRLRSAAASLRSG